MATKKAVKKKVPAGLATTIRLIEAARPCRNEYFAALIDFGGHPIDEKVRGYADSYKDFDAGLPKGWKQRIGPDDPILIEDILKAKPKKSHDWCRNAWERVDWIIMNNCLIDNAPSRLLDKLDQCDGLSVRIVQHCDAATIKRILK